MKPKTPFKMFASSTYDNGNGHDLLFSDNTYRLVEVDEGSSTYRVYLGIEQRCMKRGVRGVFVTRSQMKEKRGRIHSISRVSVGRVGYGSWVEGLAQILTHLI